MRGVDVRSTIYETSYDTLGQNNIIKHSVRQSPGWAPDFIQSAGPDEGEPFTRSSINKPHRWSEVTPPQRISSSTAPTIHL